ncbi:MAG: hypothetical protein K8W52_20260 [Deltaproteobacteria bacterium]|nr:hypothetical protein [Deltaproteobacteria bacterium]
MRTRTSRFGVLIVALALLLCGAARAFAGYDARGAELRDILAKKELDQATKEREVLTRALDEYLRTREQCLQDLVKIVEEPSPGRTEQERVWDERLAACRQEASKIGDAIKGIPGVPTIGAFNFINVTQVEEEKFFATLDRVQVGERRDRLVANQKNLLEMTQALDEKWRSLVEQDKVLDEREKQVVDDLGAIIDRAFDAADRERRTLKEKVVNGGQQISAVVKRWGKPIAYLLGALTGADLHALEEGIKVFKEADPAISAYSKIYAKTNADYIGRAADYAALLQSERGGIFVLYGGFYRDTKQFLEKNGFDIAKVDYQLGSEAMSAWASGAATAGQRADADAFGRDVLARLSAHLAETEKKFNEFVARHKGKFFGPIAPEITEALAETRVWEDWARMIEGKNLDAKLRQWRNEANDNNVFFTVSIDGLTDADRGELRREIQPRIDELVQSLDDAATIPQRFRKDFDRSRLGDELK